MNDLTEIEASSQSEALNNLDELGFKTNKERETFDDIEGVLSFIEKWTEKETNCLMI